MRLYYPVLLVAAVAIATTNVYADDFDEERGGNPYTRLEKGESSTGKSYAIEDDTLNAITKYLEDRGGLGDIVNKKQYQDLNKFVKGYKLQTEAFLHNTLTMDQMISEINRIARHPFGATQVNFHLTHYFGFLQQNRIKVSSVKEIGHTPWALLYDKAIEKSITRTSDPAEIAELEKLRDVKFKKKKKEENE